MNLSQGNHKLRMKNVYERENLILKIAKNKNKNTLLNQSWRP